MIDFSKLTGKIFLIEGTGASCEEVWVAQIAPSGRYVKLAGDRLSASWHPVEDLELLEVLGDRRAPSNQDRFERTV